MARRASNRERVQKAAMEAELTAKEKAKKTADDGEKAPKKKKKTTKAKSTTKTAAASGDRVKLVWKVLDPKSKEIATFPYPKKDEAEAKAALLADKKGQEYRVRGVKVPFDQDV